MPQLRDYNQFLMYPSIDSLVYISIKICVSIPQPRLYIYYSALFFSLSFFILPPFFPPPFSYIISHSSFYFSTLLFSLIPLYECTNRIHLTIFLLTSILVVHECLLILCDCMYFHTNTSDIGVNDFCKIHFWK